MKDFVRNKLRGGEVGEINKQKNNKSQLFQVTLIFNGYCWLEMCMMSGLGTKLLKNEYTNNSFS
jgi:hypothetical protein